MDVSLAPSGGFITVLADAYLVRSSNPAEFVVYGEASGAEMCRVRAGIAHQALAHPDDITFLGDWQGTFRGRRDTWTIWYAHEVPWAATAEVRTVPHAARLIFEFIEAAASAEREGRVHSPSPPPSPLLTRRDSSRRGGGFFSGFAEGFGSAFGSKR